MWKNNSETIPAIAIGGVIIPELVAAEAAADNGLITGCTVASIMSYHSHFMSRTTS